jgi:Cu2+-containing amine oxidase
MKQYECLNVPQVARKVAELTGTKIDRETWKYYCGVLRGSGRVSDTVDYIDGNDNDVIIFFGFDGHCWYVGIDE